MRIGALIAFISALAFPAMAAAHGSAPHKTVEKKPISTEEKPFGRAGDVSKVTRKIKVDMSDRMRFSPEILQIRRGEVVRFDVKNSGKVMHEMVLGTIEELKEHADLMRKHPGMEHDERRTSHREGRKGSCGSLRGRASSTTAA